MSIAEQSLFDADSIQLAWERYHARHPEVLAEIERIVFLAKDRGERRFSMKLAFELVRSNAPSDDAVIRLNNNHTAPATRELIRRRPDLASMFRTRKRHV